MGFAETLLAIVGTVVGGVVIAIWIYHYFDLERRRLQDSKSGGTKRSSLITETGLTCEHSWEKMEAGTISAPSFSKFVCVLHCFKCGSIDKTVESVYQCQHKWTEADDTILDSPYEQIRKMFQTTKRNGGKSEIEIPSPRDSKRWIFRKTLMRERICRSCGEIHTVTVSNILDDGEEPAKTPQMISEHAEQVD